jgi:hypothetical protein
VRARHLILVTAVAALALGADASANQIKPKPADQKAATAALLRLSELPDKTWTGGVAAYGGEPLSCANFHPKATDLVTTGRAESTFKRSGATVTNTVDVLQTPAMVELDMTRTLTAQFLPCLASKFKQQGTVVSKVVSATRLTLPNLATHTAGFRIMWTATSNGQTAYGIDDLILYAGKRVEVSLTAEVIFQSLPDAKAAAASLTAFEVKLARKIVPRALGKSASLPTA